MALLILEYLQSISVSCGLLCLVLAEIGSSSAMFLGILVVLLQSRHSHLGRVYLKDQVQCDHPARGSPVGNATGRPVSAKYTKRFCATFQPTYVDVCSLNEVYVSSQLGVMVAPCYIVLCSVTCTHIFKSMSLLLASLQGYLSKHTKYYQFFLAPAIPGMIRARESVHCWWCIE